MHDKNEKQDMALLQHQQRDNRSQNHIILGSSSCHLPKEKSYTLFNPLNLLKPYKLLEEYFLNISTEFVRFKEVYHIKIYYCNTEL